MLVHVCSLLSAIILQNQVPQPGMLIAASCRLSPGNYLVRAPGDAPTILIKGDNITVDFKGVVLNGTPPTTEPDQRVGTGVFVLGKNVTIKNLTIRGYKVGLMARQVPGLKLLECDFSYNWKQHLRSTLEREDESDWQSYHNNEHDEWLRYGAGAYLEDCDGFEIRGCKATGGQCGLMLTRCTGGKVWNNDCSFMSGLGLGMYRSSNNQIMHNRFDWCVRGFSYGVYNRGQDSAGILVYEQSSNNLFAYNSATHGGDGFFLWAGQHTMDTGEGGCNDNLLYGNDFSHSPANGIEATFSRNTFANNLCAECDYGIWGGYSFDSLVQENEFVGSRIGAAFEHSQKCIFNDNYFLHDKAGIQLWGTGTPDPNWGYGKHRDIRSLDNKITDNLFVDVPGPCIWLRSTVETSLSDNAADEPTKGMDVDAGNSLVGKAELSGMSIEHEATRVRWTDLREYPGDIKGLTLGWDALKPHKKITFKAPSPLVGGMNPFLPTDALRGRRYMLVDDWGPYDFRYPRLWPRGENSNGEKVFEVLGPKGTWKVLSSIGATVTGAGSGKTPANVTVKVPSGVAKDVQLTLQYVGAAVTDFRGVTTPAGKPVTFSYSQFFAPIDWNIEFFQWDKNTDPRKDEHAFRVLLAGPPIASAHANKLDYGGYGAWAKGVPENYFAISANGDFTIDEGKYTIDVTTDDGCRIFLDGQPLQLYDGDGKPASAFHYQGPTSYTAPVKLSKGKHHVYLEYFQIDGYKTIQIRLKKG